MATQEPLTTLRSAPQSSPALPRVRHERCGLQFWTPIPQFLTANHIFHPTWLGAYVIFHHFSPCCSETNITFVTTCCKKWGLMAFNQTAEPWHQLSGILILSTWRGGQESGPKQAPQVILIQLQGPQCEKQLVERLKWCPDLETYCQLNTGNHSFKPKHHKTSSMEILLWSYSSTGGFTCDINTLKCSIRL